jgi:HK97 family phage prohead protease
MIRQSFPSRIRSLGEREIEAIIMTGGLARDGYILVPQGGDLESYRRNPIVLAYHNPTLPVGRAANIVISNTDIRALIVFAPLGAAETADEVCRLVKAGVISTLSIGFIIRDGDPLDPKRPYGGKRITNWELLEVSFVSVPADTNAVVIARGGIGYRERRAEIARLRRYGGPPASSPPSSLTYRMGESPAHLAVRVRDGEIAQRLTHFHVASRNYHGEWFPWQERQAEIARLRRQL